MSTKQSSLTESYIEGQYENSKKISYLELSAEDGLSCVNYGDLQKTEVEGYPVAADLVDCNNNHYTFEEYIKTSVNKRPELDLSCSFLPYSHELYIGTTGAGKSVMLGSQISIASSLKNKPNLFITDPKGEMAKKNIKHLKKNGYKIFALNFKEPMRSNRFNPLAEIYDLKMRALNVGSEVKSRKGEVKNRLEKISNSDMDFGDEYLEYNDKAFPNKAMLINYLDFERCSLETELDSAVNSLAHMFIKVQSNTDKSWEYGAQDLFKGLVQSLLDCSAKRETGFTGDMLTVRSIYNLYTSLRSHCTNESNSLSNHPIYRHISQKSRTLLALVMENAPNTRRSYMGVFEGAIKNWFQSHIFALTTGHDINIGSAEDSPFAIFLITRDYDKSDFEIAGIFIDWVYRVMLKNAEKRIDGKNQRATHFLLDEFGNISEIRDLENKIATARSRNIWFHLFVQSFKQIEIVYGLGKSIVIRDNCNTQIFLGTQNRETKEQFSAECGKHMIPTLSALHNEHDYSFAEIPLIPVSELDLIKSGEMYVKRIYKPVFVSYFIRNYEAELLGIFEKYSGELNDDLPLCLEAFDSPKYTFDIDKGASCDYGDFSELYKNEEADSKKEDTVSEYDKLKNEEYRKRRLEEIERRREALMKEIFDSDDTMEKTGGTNYN